jgi:hypothetical protein
VVAPALKVTVPVGVPAGWFPATVAVRVTGSPKRAVAGVATSDALDVFAPYPATTAWSPVTLAIV